MILTNSYVISYFKNYTMTAKTKNFRLITFVKIFIGFSIALLLVDGCMILMSKWLSSHIAVMTQAHHLHNSEQILSFLTELTAKTDSITTNLTFVTMIFLFLSILLSTIFFLKPENEADALDFDDINDSEHFINHEKQENNQHDKDLSGEALLKAGLLKAEAIRTGLIDPQETITQEQKTKASETIAESVDDESSEESDTASDVIFPDEMDEDLEVFDNGNGAEGTDEEAREKELSEEESPGLAHSYNKMVVVLKKFHELERQHSVELADANTKLQKEIVERKKAEAEIRHLSNRLISGIEEARKELAQDLHDEFGQTLTALHLGLEGLWSSIPDDLWEQKKRIDGLVMLIEQLGDKIRSISSALRPDLLDDLGLAPTIEWYINEFSESHPSIQCTFQAVGFRRRLPPAVELVLYRIFQESMNNVVKHAKADIVNVNLTYSHPKILMTVKDNGIGFDTHKTFDGIGLLGMRERVGSVNGLIEIHSGKNKGVTIRVELPVEH